jgi:hypothetical protein
MMALTISNERPRIGTVRDGRVGRQSSEPRREQSHTMDPIASTRLLVEKNYAMLGAAALEHAEKLSLEAISA